MRNNRPLSPVADRIANAWRGGTHYIVVAPPKSASTFFSGILAECTGLEREVYWDEISGPNDISIARAIDLSDADYIIHCHSLPSIKMTNLLAAIDARPIILHRPIADCIVSMNDHRIRVRTTTMDQALECFDKEDQLRLTASEWINWYCQYEFRWTKVPADSRLDVEFRELTQSPASAVSRALKFWKLEPEVTDILALVDEHQADTARSNINVGKIGRGASLPDDVKQILRLHQESFRKIFAKHNIQIKTDGIFF